MNDNEEQSEQTEEGEEQQEEQAAAPQFVTQDFLKEALGNFGEEIKGILAASRPVEPVREEEPQVPVDEWERQLRATITKEATEAAMRGLGAQMEQFMLPVTFQSAMAGVDPAVYAGMTPQEMKFVLNSPAVLEALKNSGKTQQGKRAPRSEGAYQPGDGPSLGVEEEIELREMAKHFADIPGFKPADLKAHVLRKETRN